MTVVVAFLNILFLAGVIFWFYRHLRNSDLLVHYFPALFIKLAAGIALGLVYRHYYTGGDTFNYFHDAVGLAGLVHESPASYLKAIFLTEIPLELGPQLKFLAQPRALFMAKLVSFFSLITLHNYWLSSLYLSFFSFAGMYCLASKLVKFFPKTAVPAVVAFLYFPSVVFWSSGVMKEAFAMGAMAFMISLMLPYLIERHRLKWHEILLILLLVLLLFKLKYYYAAVLAPVLLALVIVSFFIKNGWKIVRNNFTNTATFLLMFCLLLLGASQLHPVLSPELVLYYIVDTHDLIAARSAAADLVHFKGLEADWGSFIANFPLALFSGLFRPGIWEVKGFFQIITGLENLMMLLMVFYSFGKIPPMRKSPHLHLIVAVLVFVIILAAFMAFSSPNFGTLMRYKVGFLPFFIYLLLIGNPVVKWSTN